MVLRNTSERSLSVAVTGPARLREALTVAPGAEQAVTVPDSGLVRLQIGRATKVLYAEGYTQVTIPVP